MTENPVQGGNMANHKSAIKRHKQSLKRAARNRSRRTRVKNVLKEARSVLMSGEKTVIDKALSTANSVLGKVAAKGTIHWKTAARKMSRLAKAANKALSK